MTDTDATNFFDWLDEQDDPVEREPDGWTCDTIEKAESAARRLRRAADKLHEIDKTAERIAADAAEWAIVAGKRYQSTIDLETASLETFLQVQIAEGGPKSAPLPWGVSVSARKTGGTLEFAPDFADSAPDDVVRVKRSIDAKAAKAYYTIAGESVVDPNGEVVEGVTVKPVGDKFEVKA